MQVMFLEGSSAPEYLALTIPVGLFQQVYVDTLPPLDLGQHAQNTVEDLGNAQLGPLGGHVDIRLCLRSLLMKRGQLRTHRLILAVDEEGPVVVVGYSSRFLALVGVDDHQLPLINRRHVDVEVLVALDVFGIDLLVGLGNVL